MLIRPRFSPAAPHLLPIPTSSFPAKSHFPFPSPPKPNFPNFTITRARTSKKVEAEAFVEYQEEEEEVEGVEEEVEGVEEEFSYSSGYRGREDEKKYDRDPEFADILGSCFDDPQKAQTKLEERIRKKRSKILHNKTGSATPIQVRFNNFDFSNSYIWFEFYNAPLPQDITLICDTIRSWHIIGRLGGCNSMNMQLSQSPLDNKIPKYDAIQGANVTPTTFYNIGDLEVQDNLARLWVDIGTSEPLLLDVLINALTCISSEYRRFRSIHRSTDSDLIHHPGLRTYLLSITDPLQLVSHIGIKQLVFGGSEFENWKENLTSEEVGFSTHKI